MSLVFKAVLEPNFPDTSPPLFLSARRPFTFTAVTTRWQRRHICVFISPVLSPLYRSTQLFIALKRSRNSKHDYKKTSIFQCVTDEGLNIAHAYNHLHATSRYLSPAVRSV